MSILSNIIKGIPLGKSGIRYNPISILGGGISLYPKKQTLPNGDSFQAVTSKINTPDSVQNPTNIQQPVANPNIVKTFNQTQNTENNQNQVQNQTQKYESGVPSKYINPTTGSIYSPKDYAEKINTDNSGNGDIPQYAGDVLTQGDQSIGQLQERAAGLNNARNDIATGTTDPYKITNNSGIAYSPLEMKAIENAYAGIYDPAINSALAKLNAKQKRDEQVFRTNEDIRRWKATSGFSGISNNNFSNTQTNKGASKMGISINNFKNIDPDLKNFFINTPKAKDVEGVLGPIGDTVNMDALLNAYIDQVKSGQMKSNDVKDDITNSSLPKSVKHYFITKVPGDKKVNPSYFKRVWGYIKNEF